MVRILRGTDHLQSNSLIHWTTWLGCVFGFSVISFVIAEGVPIFNYLLALLGSIVDGPVMIMFPAYLWLYDHWDYFGQFQSLTKKVLYVIHWIMLIGGAFITVSGTYAVCLEIKQAYDTGEIGKQDYTGLLGLHV